MSGPPDEDTTLEHFPWVVIRFRCTLCKRWADARLAKVACKFGHGETIGALVRRFTSTCPNFAFRRNGVRYPDQQCGGYCPDVGRHGPPDLPPSMSGLTLIEGGKDGLLAEQPARQLRRKVGGTE